MQMTPTRLTSGPLLWSQGRRAHAPAAGTAQGFTIIELMIVVAIVVILIAIAGPDFRSMIAASRVKDASFDVFSSLVHARSEAVTRNATVRICRGTNWASGWTITFAADCDPGNITPANTIRKQDAVQGITIASVPSGVTSICFNGTGRLNATAPCAAASFGIDAPGVIDRNKRCVTIDPSGRPVTKVGSCS